MLRVFYLLMIFYVDAFKCDFYQCLTTIKIYDNLIVRNLETL